MSAEERRGTLLHEKDGDFNPGWALFILFALVGVVTIAAGLWVATSAPEKAWPVAVGAMIFDAVAMLICAGLVVSIARARVLLNSSVIGAGLSALGRLGGGYPGDPETMVDREHEVVEDPR